MTTPFEDAAVATRHDLLAMLADFAEFLDHDANPAAEAAEWLAGEVGTSHATAYHIAALFLAALDAPQEDYHA